MDVLLCMYKRLTYIRNKKVNHGFTLQLPILLFSSYCCIVLHFHYCSSNSYLAVLYRIEIKGLRMVINIIYYLDGL